jgi:hypothetical protein
MQSNWMRFSVLAMLAMLVSIWMGSGAIAQSEGWHVSKSSGEVWVQTSGAQPVALRGDVVLKPGDSLRTGQNGRVLLARGAETILVSANSVLGIPAEKMDGYSTTIVQQAGSILLDVEKRNVQHFEVATPYLAAVVKGTQFRVTVEGRGSQVEVIGGQVQVTDYKTGQYALVNPGQAARVSLSGPAGLSLAGSGTLSPIQSGPPRSPSVSPIAIPGGGSAAPSDPSPPPPTERRAQTGPVSPDATAPVRRSDAGQGYYKYGPITPGGQESSPPTARAPLTREPAASRVETSDAGSDSDGWMADLIGWARSTLGLGSHNHRGDTYTGILAVPALVGFSVALGAGLYRRRRQR